MLHHSMILVNNYEHIFICYFIFDLTCYIFVNRVRLAKVWEKAVYFLQANESRIKVEMKKNDQGEEYKVWRWIQVREE